METVKILISNIFNKIKNNDKVLHLLANLFTVIFFGLIFGTLQGIITAIFVSLCKELYDKYIGNKFNWDDIVADIIGILIGLFIIL